MILEYMQKIKDWLVLKSGKEVARFLGFTRYYRTFILQYSVLNNQLNRIKKAEKFVKNQFVFVYEMVPGTSWFQFHCDT